jgi:hypothetical protein
MASVCMGQGPRCGAAGGALGRAQAVVRELR